MHWWQSFRLGLTCSTAYRYDVAKHVIIAGAGAFLLTDGAVGTPDLLPKDTYAIFKTDGSDLDDVVHQSLSNPKLTEHRRAGSDHVARHHTHALRWKQLLAHMADVK